MNFRPSPLCIKYEMDKTIFLDVLGAFYPPKVKKVRTILDVERSGDLP